MFRSALVSWRERGQAEQLNTLTRRLVNATEGGGVGVTSAEEVGEEDDLRKAARRRASRLRALKITSLPNAAHKLLSDLVCFRHSPLSSIDALLCQHPIDMARRNISPSLEELDILHGGGAFNGLRRKACTADPPEVHGTEH